MSVDEYARPKFFKSRPVPLATKAAMERELDRLESKGVLEKVYFSDWAAPVVVVLKDSQVQLCGDYKITVNPILDIDQYPLSLSNELFATLAEGTFFTKLDLTHAY